TGSPRTSILNVGNGCYGTATIDAIVAPPGYSVVWPQHGPQALSNAYSYWIPIQLDATAPGTYNGDLLVYTQSQAQPAHIHLPGVVHATISTDSVIRVSDWTGSEHDGNATFTVTRTGSTSQAATVDYRLVPELGSARQGVDVSFVSGTLTFAVGET